MEYFCIETSYSAGVEGNLNLQYVKILEKDLDNFLKENNHDFDIENMVYLSSKTYQISKKSYLKNKNNMFIYDNFNKKLNKLDLSLYKQKVK
jgi:hypothetical protein